MHKMLPILIAIVVSGSTLTKESERQAFKKKMIPRLGRVVTIVGSLEDDGKVGEFLKTDDGGHVHFQASNSAARARRDELYRLMSGKRVSVTATLQFAEATIFKNPDGSIRSDVSGITEHFYINIAEATIHPAARER
jgi:hypothetical protein